MVPQGSWGEDETEFAAKATSTEQLHNLIVQALVAYARQQVAGWQETATQESRNRDYYRSLVIEIGELFGDEAHITDDGARSEDVLCAKVIELVRTHLYELRIECESVRQQVKAYQAVVTAALCVIGECDLRFLGKDEPEGDKAQQALDVLHDALAAIGKAT